MTLPNLGIVLGAAGAMMYTFVQIGRSILASRWPTTEGEVTTARVVRRSDAEGTYDSEYVGYRYEVGGRLYRNDRLSFGPQVLPRSVVPSLDPEPKSSPTVDSLRAKYPRGKPVRVYYNPRRPEDSVLHPAPNATVWILTAAALVFGYAALQSAF